VNNRSPPPLLMPDPLEKLLFARLLHKVDMETFRIVREREKGTITAIAEEKSKWTISDRIYST